MARRMQLDEEVSFAEGLKTLKDEELLDFWEQTQQLEASLRDVYPALLPSQDYEAMIVHELQLRTLSQRPART